MTLFHIEKDAFDRLQNAMENYVGDSETIINEVLHNQAGQLILDEIKHLMPTSNRKWNGKKAPAKTGSSLMIVNGNLSVTVKTTKNFQYLYFPDDGTNTRNHAGNKQFFLHGAENQTDEIINRCINILGVKFEDAVE